jgi:hypothetical protein
VLDQLDGLVESGTIGELIMGILMRKRVVVRREKPAQRNSWKKSEVARLEELLLEYGTDYDIVGRLLGRERNNVRNKVRSMQRMYPNFGFIKI